ncbi:transcriptional regulator [Gallibacterium genomosp. 3]|uniref:Transcriptional regulator n=1 Tax=Gallibacterium genomosp. 3 TaxID=505345 RepID=A0A1A7NTH4_9PAST|nr:RNA-binding domain-containing protein [Gallibacterium genomosp. 3]OBW92958.1 transcriptional regulator [Gallibacterium genomosp. 3]
MDDKLPINIQDLLNRKTIEDERIEFKENWNPEAVLHTLCAFANDFHNLGGGYLIIGVTENNGMPQLPPTGLAYEQVDKIRKELLQLEKSAIVPTFHTLTATYEIQGKLILVLWAVGGEMRPYRAKKSLSDKNSENWAYYIRQHSNTIEAKGEIEQELLSLANKVPFDDRLCLNATLDDLEPHLIREFLAEIKSELATTAKHLSIEELAKRMNIVGGTSEALFPKNVGLLFFNSQPDRFFPYTQIDVVYFPEGTGANRLEEKIFKGPLARITQEALQYIQHFYLKEIVLKIPHQAKAKRFWNYPFAAIEEAVVNAVYHRSYEIREPIEIRINQESIEVISFPGPDRSIKLDDLQNGRAVSRRYRNRRVGEFLKDLDLTEGRSTGIPKIIRVMQENGSPDAVFETDEERTFFLIRLPIHSEAKTVDRNTDLDIDLDTDLDTDLDIGQDKRGEMELVPRLLNVLMQGEQGISQLMQQLNIQHKPHFRKSYLTPALTAGLIAMTIPEKPTSRHQRYRLTAKGQQYLTAIKAKDIKD